MTQKHHFVHIDGSMFLSLPPWEIWAEKRITLVFLLLLFLLGGCSSPNGQHSAPIPTATRSRSGPVAITLSDALHCPPEEYSIVPQGLIFATDRLSYTSTEIEQMANYITTALSIFSSGGPEELQSLPQPPSTLRLVPSSLTNSIGNWNLSPEKRRPGCIEEMTITNVSKEPVLFQSIQVRLTKAPERNLKRYRFLNVCSFFSQKLVSITGSCPLYPQGTTPDGSYEFALHQAQAGTVFPGALQAQAGYPTPVPTTRQNLSLAPGQKYVLHLNFHTPVEGGNWKYTLVSEINVTTASGQEETLQADSVETLVYTNPNQVSCYTLHGNTFAPLSQEGVGASYEAMGTQFMNNGTWCL